MYGSRNSHGFAAEFVILYTMQNEEGRSNRTGWIVRSIIDLQSIKDNPFTRQILMNRLEHSSRNKIQQACDADLYSL